MRLRHPRQDHRLPRTEQVGLASSLQKGMSEEQVRALLGAPTNSSDADHDGIQVHSETYTQGNSVVTAQFVNGVLVKYSIEVH